MLSGMGCWTSMLARLACAGIAALISVEGAWAVAPVVPGTGQKAEEVGDDFEDSEWEFVFNNPKSSKNIDETIRHPLGKSKNSRWYESTLRGQPDIVKRVPTPEGGIPGSTGSLLMRSLRTGVPGRVTNESQQDDLLVNSATRLRGYVPVSWSPSIVVRVYLPPWEEWEQRTATSFGFRADCRGRKSNGDVEAYWPGMFIQFNRKGGRRTEDSAQLLIRSRENGSDVVGPAIKEPGWWTLGMSFTSDGAVHYYAHAGVEDLTPADRLASHFPYSFRCERLQTFFFNVANFDNGQSWSTPWIIDDPTMYFTRR